MEWQILFGTIGKDIVMRRLIVMKRNLKTFILFCIMLMGIQFAEIQAEASITSIAEGSYTLKNVGTGKYLNVYGNKNANNTNIDVYSKDNTNGQDFKIYKYGESYALNPLCSSTGRVVNVYAENAKSGNNVCLWDRTNHSTQLWKFDKVDGGYVIRSANNTSCVLNATGSKNNANVNITTYKSGNKNQIWVLESPATTTNPATSTLKIESVSKPETITQGNAFSIKGTISSNYTLNSVMGQILKSDRKTVVYEKTVNPNAKTYNLYNSSVDTALLFNKLSVGTYYYKVFAKDVSGKSVVLVDSKFTVKSKTAATTQKPSTTEKATTEKATTEKSTTTEKQTNNTVSNITNTVNEKVDQGVKKTSKLKISNYNYPTTIYVGNAFTIKGKITSNYKITSVTGEIVKVGAIKATYTKTVTPNKTSYSLKNSKIDTSLLFDKLSKGEYYYKITATDAIGNEKVVVNKKFVVKQPQKKELTIDKKLINKVGWQTPYTNYCMAYSTAYCRTILDKKIHYYTEYWSESRGCLYGKANYKEYTYKSKEQVLRMVYDQINKGKPCIIYVNQSSGGQHYVVAYGYQGVKDPNNMSITNLMIIDPIKRKGTHYFSGSKVKNAMTSLKCYKSGKYPVFVEN